MAKKPRPKVVMWPDEDKEWGGYNDAVQCIHCRRWMVLDWEKTYHYNDKRRHHQIFKELNWDGWNWYIDSRRHSPELCELQRERMARAKAEGFKSYKAYSRWLDSMVKKEA